MIHAVLNEISSLIEQRGNLNDYEAHLIVRVENDIKNGVTEEDIISFLRSIKHDDRVNRLFCFGIEEFLLSVKKRINASS